LPLIDRVEQLFDRIIPSELTANVRAFKREFMRDDCSSASRAMAYLTILVPA